MSEGSNSFSTTELQYLARCVDIAEEALRAGDAPFGSILVDGKGKVIAEARNRAVSQNVLAHPEFELAEWALEYLTAPERKKVTLYTSGEHCAMCAGANAWAGIGKVVYLSSGRQLEHWKKGTKAVQSPINYIPIQEIAPYIEVKGPGTGALLERIKDLQLKHFQRRGLREHHG